MTYLLIATIAYLVFILIVGIRHARTSSYGDLIINSRSTGYIRLVSTTLATFVGGGVTVGLITMGYEAGFAATAIGLAYVLGFIVAFFLAKRMYSFTQGNGIYSFPEFLFTVYAKDSPSRTFRYMFAAVVGTVNIAIMFFLLSAQFVAMAALVHYAFGVHYGLALGASCLVVIGYTAASGLSGVIVTDLVQLLIILGLVVVVFIPGILSSTDSLARLSELPASHLVGTGYGIVFLLALPLFLPLSVIARMDIWQRVLAAKSSADVRRMLLLSGLLMLPFYIVFPLVGMSVRIAQGDFLSPKEATYSFLTSHCGEFTLAFAFIGLLAALMSSADSFLNVASISVVRDIIPMRGSEAKESRYAATVLRIVTVLVGGCAAFVAFLFPRLVDLMVAGTSAIVVFAPATLWALCSHSATRLRWTALISILVGFAVNITVFVVGVLTSQFSPKVSFIPAFIVALLVFAVWSIVYPASDGELR